jgi:putative aminopeptidase FrvX
MTPASATLGFDGKLPFRHIPLMRTQSQEFLRKLVNMPSPVGHEVRGQRVWLDYAKQFAEETFSDAYGNCVAVLNKGGSPRLMLAAHADEIAMAVNFIDDNGYIYVRKMGGVDAAITKAQRVVIHTRKGPVKGVVGNVAPHPNEARRRAETAEDTRFVH